MNIQKPKITTEYIDNIISEFSQTLKSKYKDKYANIQNKYNEHKEATVLLIICAIISVISSMVLTIFICSSTMHYSVDTIIVIISGITLIISISYIIAWFKKDEKLENDYDNISKLIYEDIRKCIHPSISFSFIRIDFSWLNENSPYTYVGTYEQFLKKIQYIISEDYYDTLKTVECLNQDYTYKYSNRYKKCICFDEYIKSKKYDKIEIKAQGEKEFEQAVSFDFSYLDNHFSLDSLHKMQKYQG